MRRLWEGQRLATVSAVGGKGDAGRMMIDAASGGAGLTKPTMNAIQGKQLDAAEQFDDHCLVLVAVFGAPAFDLGIGSDVEDAVVLRHGDLR